MYYFYKHFELSKHFMAKRTSKMKYFSKAIVFNGFWTCTIRMTGRASNHCAVIYYISIELNLFIYKLETNKIMSCMQTKNLRNCQQSPVDLYNWNDNGNWSKYKQLSKLKYSATENLIQTSQIYNYMKLETLS